MSKLAEFRAAEEELGRKLAALEALRNDTELKAEIAFERALTKLLEDHGMDRSKLLSILGADQTQDAPKAKSTNGRAPQKREIPKTFRNPHTEETITVKRLTNGRYRAWVEQYGEAVVYSWLQE